MGIFILHRSRRVNSYLASVTVSRILTQTKYTVLRAYLFMATREPNCNISRQIPSMYQQVVLRWYQNASTTLLLMLNTPA